MYVIGQSDEIILLCFLIHPFHQVLWLLSLAKDEWKEGKKACLLNANLERNRSTVVTGRSSHLINCFPFSDLSIFSLSVATAASALPNDYRI